jgi:hypothetical protein
MGIRRTPTRLTALAAIALVSGACSAGATATPPQSQPSVGAGSPSAMPAESGMSPGMSEMPMSSELANLHWTLAATGLTSGSTVTDNAVTLNVAPTGYAFSCAEAGKPNQPTIGHYHVELDHALVNMYCTPSATISMQNVDPGKHTLTVLPATNTHDELTAAAVGIDFTYQPTSPLPPITAAANAGTPTIQILSPAPGSTVSGDFTVKVQVTNFTVSGALFGKANLAGYGHWHLNVDSTTQGMMGMATMLGMSGTDTFQASTEGLSPGKHTFFAILVDDQHAPLNPAIAAQLELVVQ